MNNRNVGGLPPLDSDPPVVEKVFGTEVLFQRPFRRENLEAENRALVTLADELANQARHLLQKLAEIALELCNADSAGVSILEPDAKALRWHACAGFFAGNVGTVISRANSPCGMVLEQNAPILFEEPAIHFSILRSIEPPMTELLLLPFHEENIPVGTVWVVAHSSGRKFDREDLRLMTSLSRFASAGYHVMVAMNKSINVRDVLEKKVDERTKALSLSNKMLRQHIRERAGIEEALRNARNQLEAELSSLNRLHELSTRLLNASDLPSALKEILEAAIVLCGADMGTIQLYDPAREILTIAAHHGFEQDFLNHFSEENAEGDSACARALSTLKRVVIENIQTDERYAIHRPVAEKSGFRAVQSTPLCGRDGAPLGMLTTHFRTPHAPSERELRMVDLYARQAADFIERLRITERLQDADRRKDEFIATLSHELRNPLAAIDSSGLLLASPNLDAAKRELATRVVQRQCRAMKILLDDLLDISRLSLRRMTLHKQCVTLASIIDSAVEVAQPLIDSANHTLSLTKPPPSVLIYGDPIRLTQVLSNLLSNAVKYTDPGGRITLDVKTSADRVTVSVADNGIGIEPSRTEEIFGMFSQMKTRNDRTIAGLGIGLALVRAIAEMHGGWASAESTGLGQGSIFHVNFPLATQEEIVLHMPTSSDLADPVHEPRIPAQRRILIADDNKSAATAISMLLQRDGYEIKAVHDGRAALEEAARFRPHIALLDIGMPHLNGYEVARKIRAAPWGSSIRLVAATGWGQEKDKLLAKEAGFDAHLTKPIDFKQLLALLEEQGGKNV